MKQKLTVLTRRVESKIILVRNRKVILDTDLAALYGVPVKRLNEQVKRNADRFPSDFAFRLGPNFLRSQFATSKPVARSRGGRRSRPLAFTEHGAIMVAAVLNSTKAVEMSIFVVRAFVHLRRTLATNSKILSALKDLEHRVTGHDASITDIADAIHELMKPLPISPRKIGFQSPASAF